jgi:hypothetical protein
MSWVRHAGAVLAGYAVMAALVFGGTALAWSRMGAEGALTPGTWDASPAWAVASLVVSLLAAIAGGFVCASVSHTMRGPRTLAILVMILGLLYAMPELVRERPSPPLRPDSMAMNEFMAHARTPAWILVVTPLAGVAGVMLGAGRRLGRAEGPSSHSA